MGATNFYKVNADAYYVFQSPIPTDDREGSDDVAETTADDIQDMLLYAVECNPIKQVQYTFYRKQITSKYDLRSYPSFYIGTFSQLIPYNKKTSDIIIEFTCFTRVGYHEGMCLDWEPLLLINGQEVEEFTFSEFLLYSDYAVGSKTAVRVFNKMHVKVQERIALMKKYVHSIFGTITDKYTCISKGSDGTAIYEKDNSNNE